MDDLKITIESNDEIRIDVEENVKEVEPSDEFITDESEESDSQSLESNDEITEEITEEITDENVKEFEPSEESITDESLEPYSSNDENVKEFEPSKEDAFKKASNPSESYQKFQKLAALPYKNCDFVLIYKVSEKYRKAKEESYTPRVVSIGPLHHGKSHLQPMETFKLKCLTNLENKLRINLKTLYEYATTQEGRVRSYYQDFKFNAEDFSKMILLDGIFIILLISNNQRFKVPALKLDQNAWMLSDIMHDMLLLENQLPLYFVSGLLYILVPKPIYVNPDPEQPASDSFCEDLRNYFQEVGMTKGLKVNFACKSAQHLVDFLLQLHLPAEENQSLGYGRVEYTRSSSELQGLGVRFCPALVEGLFEITFHKPTGTLCIPKLTVNDTTETLFRNLIAFEQSQHQKHISSYVILMDSLINTDEDVKLLVKKGIIVNLLGEDQLVADLFNNLHKEVIHGRDFYFTDLCDELNKYSKDCFHQWRSSCFKWMSELKTKYFRNPWSVISFVAATVVVFLTIVQTVCSLKGLEK